MFDERGTNLQCSHCNIDLNGNYPKYFEFMLNTYGQDVIDELIVLKHKTVKLKPWDLQEIENQYKQKTAALIRG